MPGTLQEINSLRSIIDQLPPRDRRFASDLVSSYDRWGSLTPKQYPWVQKLIERVGPQQATSSEVQNGAALFGLFDSAKKTALKYPRITFNFSQDLNDCTYLHPATVASKYYGCLIITEDGGLRGKKYMGRLTPDNTFIPSHAITKEQAEHVLSRIRTMAEDPESALSQYGKLTGRCAMCNGRLKTDKSVMLGYGPVCAKKFGLNRKVTH